MAVTATQLNSIAPVLLPAEVTEPIFNKTVEASAVMQLARKVNLNVNAQTAIPVPMDIPQADWVTEAGAKPTGAAGMGVKIMQGKKVALLVPISQEVAMTNAAGLYSQLAQDLPTAIARAFDYAAIHGKAIKGGGAGPFANYLAQTPNQVTIGATAPASGGAYTDLWQGVQKVVNANVGGYAFSGFAADPRLRPELAQSVDTQGRSFFLENSFQANNGVNSASLIGYPAYFNNGVSGKYWRNGDQVQVVTLTGSPTGGTFTIMIGGQTTAPIATNGSTTPTTATVQAAIQAISVPPAFGFGGDAGLNVTVTGSPGVGPFTLTFLAGQASGPVSVDQTQLTGGTAATSAATITQTPVSDLGTRAIGGDWSQCAYGVGMDITIKVSTEASYMDAQGAQHSAFQENLLLLLVEAYFGFVVNDLQAFVAYTHAAGS